MVWNLPVIICHRGSQDYVRIVLETALRFHNTVYFLGDDTNAHFPCTEFYPYQAFQSDCIDKCYRHYSPNNAAFEKVCMERWFVIHTFMQLKRLRFAFVCDSDVLLFTNLSALPKSRIENSSVHISTTTTKYSVTAGQSIWSQQGLRQFTDFILQFYQSTDWSVVDRCWDNYKHKLTGGISDMYLLYCFVTGTTFKDHQFNSMPCSTSLMHCDLSQIFLDSVFDNSIDLNSDGFGMYEFECQKHSFSHVNMGDQMKRVFWKRGLPYGRIQSQTLVRFLSLHFHGCKELISTYASQSQKHKSVSAVLFSLNDDYSPDMRERFILCLNFLSECVDEIVYIDWGSPNGVSLFEAPGVQRALINPSLVKHYKFTREQIAKIVPTEDSFIQQSIIRNIGIRLSTKEYILSTNVDILSPSYQDLQEILQKDNRKTFYTVSRKNVNDQLVLHNAMMHPSHLRSVLQQHVKQRQLRIDTDPEAVFQEESFKKLYSPEQQSLYTAHCQYSKIWNCGDFQIAHRHVWYTIRGFEENMVVSAQGTDSVVQKKVCVYGFTLQVLNSPMVYHINHGQRSSHNPPCMNDMSHFFINLTRSENSDAWGLKALQYLQ